MSGLTYCSMKPYAPVYQHGEDDAAVANLANEMIAEQQLSEVLGEVTNAVQTEEHMNYWLPGRILRGVIDYKIEQEIDEANIVPVINGATKVVHAIYSGRVELASFTEVIEALKKQPGLMETPVVQERDETTLQASDPTLSREAARGLHKYVSHRYIGGAGTLFIALGHGGLVPGLLTYEAYRELTQARDIAFYPVRFSIDKKKDKEPRLHASEVDYLRQVAQDKCVVVFDEDCATGRTLSKACEFLSGILSQETIPLANADIDAGMCVESHTSYLIGHEALSYKS